MKKTREKLVVIGNGMAGVAFLEEMLKVDPERYDITVFGAERHNNYNRILITQVLTGEKTFEDIALHDASWYERNRIRLRTGSRIVEINRASRTLVCEDGTRQPYNRLVIATGSMPVIPPIPGSEKDGVVTFRDLDDCMRIRGLAGADGVPVNAAVIGGGLLGLEAAYGLKKLGADVTVVHLADRLMERQCDEVAAGLLSDDLESLGIGVLTGRETVEILGGDKAAGLRFADGTELEAGLVVVSVGIKPNIRLARDSGIYCSRGIVVSDTMQTFDPSVYAIGECVEHRGATFGLVAPLFEQARVLANHLAGDCRMVFTQSPASMRLKIPGVKLYSAGVVEDSPSADTIEYFDKRARTYKKLTLTDGRLSGILMYGDIADGPDLFARLVEGRDVTDERATLLLGARPRGAGPTAVDELPDSAIVCGCSGVTKGMLVEAITTKGLFTREEVRRETKATGSCGGCAGLVDRIMEATLGASFEGAAAGTGICECTGYNRDDIIKNIREKGLKTVGEVMDTLGWQSVGCDVCRPAINYYLSMVSPLSVEDDTSSRLINERVHGNVQKDETFSVVPRMYGGVVTSDELKRIAVTAEKFKLPLIKITGGQRIALFGVKREDLPEVWAGLGMPSGFAYAKALRTVKTCVGSEWCRYGTQDSLNLGVELERMLAGLWTPAKLKLGVNGCPRSCAETSIKDIGITGVAGGWEVYAGGCGGIELKGGELLASVETAGEVKDIVKAFVQKYREEAEYGERTFKWIKRVGLGQIKKSVVDDAGNRQAFCERLDMALGAAVDPWIRAVKVC